MTLPINTSESSLLSACFLNGRNKAVFFIGLILSLIILDQASKWGMVELYFKDMLLKQPYMTFWAWLAPAAQERLNFITQDITSYFSFVMVWNRGVGFGLLANNHPMIPYLLCGFSIVLSSVFAVWIARTSSFILCSSMACIIAGALSNSWDRIRFGAVIDFIDIHVAGYHWPAFNIADSLIVAGVIILAIHSFFTDIIPTANKEASVP